MAVILDREGAYKSARTDGLPSAMEYLWSIIGRPSQL